MKTIGELRAELTAVDADVQRLSGEITIATAQLEAGVEDLDAAKEIAVGKIGAESVLRARRAAAVRLRGEIAAAEQAVRDARVRELTGAIDAKQETLRSDMLVFCRSLRELEALETKRTTESQGRIMGNTAQILVGLQGVFGILGIQLQTRGTRLVVVGVDQA